MHLFLLLPYTGVTVLRKDNKAEKTFCGRASISFAGGRFYFSGDAIVQSRIHKLKHNGHSGILLGKMTEGPLTKDDRFDDAGFIVPLFGESRQRKEEKAFQRPEV